MYQANHRQRDWVYELIRTEEGKKWLKRFVPIYAKTAYTELEEVLSVGTYNESTRGMLNFLRKQWYVERSK
jgi:hypothetical protein